MEPLKRLIIILTFAAYTALLFGTLGIVVGFSGPVLIAVPVGSEANLGTQIEHVYSGVGRIDSWFCRWRVYWLKENPK